MGADLQERFKATEQASRSNKTARAAKEAVAVGSTTNFYLGPFYFLKADSLEITSVERSPTQLTVRGRYNLVTDDPGRLALDITTTNASPTPIDRRQRMQVFKGRGDFELIHPHPVPGLPHVSMYVEPWEPLGTVYFDTGTEALEAGKPDPGHFQAAREVVELTQEGWKLWCSRRLHEAIQKFERAAPLEPNSPEIWYALGDSLPRSSPEAQKAFQKAVWLDPNYRAAREALAAMQGQGELAAPEQLLSFDPVIERVVNDTLTLKRFTAADRRLSQDLVPVAENAWTVSCTNTQTLRLFEVPNPGVEQCTLIYRAKLKTEGLGGRAHLEMWCQFPGRGEYFSHGLDNVVSASNEWATCQTPFFLKKGEKPDLIKLNVVVKGAGKVWIKDVELLKGPLPSDQTGRR